MAKPSAGWTERTPTFTDLGVSSVERLLADGYWKAGVFTRFSELDPKAIEQAFAERVLAQLHQRELITDYDVEQILSQDHTGFGVWLRP